MQQVREADCSPRSNVELKNEWSYTFTPPICLNVMNRIVTNLMSVYFFVGLWNLKKKIEGLLIFQDATE